VVALAASKAAAQEADSQKASAAVRSPTPDSKAASPEGMLSALSFTSGREPISISADGLEFDYKAHVLTYKGDVVATQGDMKLQSNTLTVTLAEGSDNQLREVTAVGNVRLSKGERTATAGRAVFDQANHTVVLSENAVLRDGPNEVRGERVVVYLEQSLSVVEGGNNGNKRVTAHLFPPKKGDATPAVTPPPTVAETP